MWNWSSSNFIINLTNTSGNAFLKIDNTSGMVVPRVLPAQRPGAPEVGHTRYNTQLEYLETWNGSNWINAAGEVESIAPDDVEQLAYVSHPFRINCKNNINNNECIKEGSINFDARQTVVSPQRA